MENQCDKEPCFVISVAARMVKMHPQTLRYYERIGLIEPSRSRGNLRMYSQQDIDRLQQIQRLVSDLGVNLAGVEVIMMMTERMAQMEHEMDEMRGRLEGEIRRLRKAMAGALFEEREGLSRAEDVEQ
ncbi:MAG: helix-turn-helix transcriptional regulator [Chloroflexi bacterium]|nr:helix-turn-helix transcriptional regulator [Chloroflexota bacterium]